MSLVLYPCSDHVSQRCGSSWSYYVKSKLWNATECWLWGAFDISFSMLHLQESAYSYEIFRKGSSTTLARTDRIGWSSWPRKYAASFHLGGKLLKISACFCEAFRYYCDKSHGKLIRSWRQLYCLQSTPWWWELKSETSPKCEKKPPCIFPHSVSTVCSAHWMSWDPVKSIKQLKVSTMWRGPIFRLHRAWIWKQNIL